MRWDIINSVIMAVGAKSYLEIGIMYGDVFNQIQAERKVGVDPDLQNFKRGKGDVGYTLHESTSDDFFSSYKGDFFDVIFIDGLHKFEQVRKDLENALNILTEGGAIILHDTMPPDARYVTDEPTLKSRSGNWLWCGDVWRIFSYLCMRGDLNYWTVDEDYGCTVVLKLPRTDKGRHPDNWTYYYPNRLKAGRVVAAQDLLSKLYGPKCEGTISA